MGRPCLLGWETAQMSSSSSDGMDYGYGLYAFNGP